MPTVLTPSERPNSSTTDSVQYTRLHVTPLDESLLSVVVPSSVLPRARNISYHTIETFSEKRYGFIDLPYADAEKIKKKLNGAVLRGTKMRVEKAKPETIPQPTGDIGEASLKKEKKKSKKRKRETDVTPGVELEGRKIKRGWTTSEREMVEEKRKKSKKDRKSKDDKDKDKDNKKKKHVKSKYTDGPECLFKTKLPDASSSSKGTEDAAGPKKKRQSGRELVVHEFEKTTKHPSFLKSVVEKSSSKAVTFKDGVGWVDEDGAVVESVVSNRPKDKTSKRIPAESKLSVPTPVPEGDDTTSSSGSSSDESEADEVSDEETDSPDEDKAETMAPPKKLKVDVLPLANNTSSPKTESARPKSSSSITSLTIKIPPATPAATKVHPLEALYKRTTDDTTSTSQAAQPFSFFDGDDEDIEEEDTPRPSNQAPMTPFTKQDFDVRNVRSAAPTPDTAHPSRTFNLWPRQNSIDEEDEDEEEEGDEEDGNSQDAIMSGTGNEATADGAKQASVRDFQKQFWEGRGDLNRSWRKRRKAASKEKRYRENRARAERAI
ncbi:hypothetical protein GGR52DRAFT_541791 [Hypoxylon sp. FL1284]|nr:hypothetical protein GGR52DRAFT_541791 [Hypoxylon sp. FL1284]